MSRDPNKRFLGFLSGLIAVTVIAGTAQSGSLEPTAAPAPTFKTLDQIPPTWSQVLPASERFELVLDGIGALDKETGLVWQQSPNTTELKTWFEALGYCRSGFIGGPRMGWRLPKVEELHSLLDPNEPPIGNGPHLPVGHPFDITVGHQFWTINTDSADPGRAAIVVVATLATASFTKTLPSNFTWCVRGGQGYDAF